jgi:HD-GYP domain-containing protein (c-di-GMP phosphodiesterase class II)
MDDYEKLKIYQTINHTQRGQVYFQPNGHGDRVSALCIRFAKFMSCDSLFIKQIKWGGLLHDAGKITIDPKIIEKVGRLSPDEWLIVKSHPEKAFEVLESLQLKDNTIPLMILYHHVNYDGTGYPHCNLREQDIPLGARMLRIIDPFDAMTNPRIYRAREREAMTPTCAIKHLVKEADKLDPFLLSQFIELVKVTK